MADLLITTLATAQPGLIHTCDTDDTPIETNNASYKQIRDGANNETNLWLTSDRNTIYIGQSVKTIAENPNDANIFIIDDDNDQVATTNKSILYHESPHNVGGGEAILDLQTQWEANEWTGHNIISSNDTSATVNTLTLSSYNIGVGGKMQFMTGNLSPAVMMTLNESGSLGIGTGNPSEKVEIVGNLKLTGGLLIQDEIIYFVDAVNGNDSNAGTSLAQALLTIDECLNRINGTSGGDFEIRLVGFDNTSSGFVADNGYTIGVDCELQNCTIKVKGVKFDGTDLSTTDTEHDYPRLTFTTNSDTSRSSYGFWLDNSSIRFILLRLVTPIWVGADEVLDNYTDGLVKTTGRGYDAQFVNCRVELGDSPLVTGKIESTIHCNFNKSRVIRSNTAITYTTNGQTGGQDNSGTAGIPVYVTDHWENVYSASYGTKGLLTNFHQGSIYYRGDDTGDGQYGAYPSNDTVAYDYDAPDNNDQPEGEQNLFGNIDAQYTLTTDGSTAGSTPLNFNTNKFAGWYLY